MDQGGKDGDDNVNTPTGLRELLARSEERRVGKECRL